MLFNFSLGAILYPGITLLSFLTAAYLVLTKKFYGWNIKVFGFGNLLNTFSIFLSLSNTKAQNPLLASAGHFVMTLSLCVIFYALLTINLRHRKRHVTVFILMSILSVLFNLVELHHPLLKLVAKNILHAFLMGYTALHLYRQRPVFPAQYIISFSLVSGILVILTNLYRILLDHDFPFLQQPDTLLLLISLTTLISNMGYFLMLSERRSQIIYRLKRINYEKRKKLDQTNALKNKMFAIISHDLRGPISAMHSLLKILHDEYSDKVPDRFFKKSLQAVAKSSERSNNLLNNLLTWSLSQQDKIEFHPQQQALRPLLEQNTELLLPISRDKHITILNEISPETSAYFDANMLQTVVRNILSNALKYTPEGGSIRLSAQAQENYLLVQIADTGIGMSDETREKVFAPKHSSQSKPGTKGETGTAFGLMICKEFIEKHGGNICCEANKPVGTVLKFTLPLQNKADKEGVESRMLLC